MSITMNGYSTLTQKGQVAIPKPIRDKLRLKASDRIYFTLEDKRIIAEAIPDVEEMKGFIPAKKALSKSEMKAIVRKHIIKKHEDRTRYERTR